MKYLLRATVLLLALLGLIATPSRAAETLPWVVVGYYPSWHSALPIEKINFRQFTHIIHAFATIRRGSLHTEGNLPSSELTRAAHAAGVKVLLGLGGADSGPGFSAVTRDPATEATCIRDLVKLVTDNGYDGIDVDWEFPTAADTPNVVAFVGKLREALQKGNPQALVTMPLSNSDYYGKYFDGPGLAKLVDFVMIMTYEVHGPWKDGPVYSHAGFNAPLHETDSDRIDGNRYSFQKSIDYWRGKGFSDQQLVAGIPCFGHGFMVEKWADTPLVPSKHTDVEYRNIQAFLDAGWQRHWDDQAGVPWLQSPPALPPELITYDDPQSVELKGKWAREAGLRGIFFWEISQDFIQGRNPLVEAARQGFGHPVP